MSDMNQNKTTKTPGRNDPCPCGSGKKYKKCCGLNAGKSDSRVAGKSDIESGFNHYHQGDIARALSIALRLVHVKPDLPEAHLLKGMCNYSQGKLSQAKENLLQVDALSNKFQDKNNIPAYKLALATLEQELGNYENAERYARDALNLGLNDSLTNNALGAALMAQDRFKEAKKAFQQALGFDATDAEIWENLGRCNHLLLEYEEAKKSYQKALALNPALASAYKALGATYMEQSKYAAAINQFQLFLKNSSEDASVTSNLGLACAYQGRLDEAYEWLTKSLSLDADRPSTYFAFGEFYSEKGDVENSNKMFSKALELEPENEFFLFRIAGSLEQMNLIKEAKVLLNKLVCLDLDSDNIYLLLAKVLLSRLIFREKHVDVAMSQLKEIEPFITMDSPALYRYYFELGYQLDKAGEYERAFSAYEKGNKEKQKFKGASFSIEEEKRLNKYLRNISTSNFIESHKYQLDENSNSQPVFIVGFPRSGSTLLEQILSQHSQIGAGGELFAISRVLKNLDKILEVKGRFPFPEILDELAGVTKSQIKSMRSLYYESVADEVNIGSNKRWFTDKMPDNLHYLGLITVLFPESPIIHIRRHPLSACLSAFMVDFRESHEYSLNIKDTAACYSEQMKLAQYYINNLQMKYMEIRYEDLVNNNEQVIRQALNFIGEDWETQCLEFYKSNRVARTASYDQVTKKLYTGSLLRHVHYEKQLKEVAEILEPIIREYEQG